MILVDLNQVLISNFYTDKSASKPNIDIFRHMF